MTQHTPGPWRVMGAPKEGLDAEKSYEIVGGAYSSLLATTCMLSGSQHERWEALANAQLMASAPVMATALLTIIRQALQGAVLERDCCIRDGVRALHAAGVLPASAVERAEAMAGGGT